MARIPEGPWWWEQKQQYAVRIRGKRHLLGENKKKATDRFHELMSKPDAPPPKPALPPNELPICTMIDLFLNWTKAHREEGTFDWYQKYLQSFLDSLENQKMPAEAVEPEQVETWANSHGWGEPFQFELLRPILGAGVKSHSMHDEMLDRLNGEAIAGHPREIFANLIQHLPKNVDVVGQPFDGG